MAELLRLRVVGIGDKDLRVLRSLLSLAPEGSIPRCQVDHDLDEAEADGVLVDVDSAPGRAYWESRPTQGLPVVALTRRRDYPALLQLNKPLRSSQVLQMIGWLNDPDSMPKAPEEWPVMSLGNDDEPLPLGEHLRRHNWDQPVQIMVGAAPGLIIDPGSGVWYYGGSDREMSELLATRMRRSNVNGVSSHQLVELTGRLEQQNLSNLKWRAGLGLSDGALHPDLAGTVRFMLPQVPLQALSDTAYSRQARILIKQPLLADELVSASGADRDDVAQFLNACHTCGFLLLDRRDGKLSAG